MRLFFFFDGEYVKLCVIVTIIKWGSRRRGAMSLLSSSHNLHATVNVVGVDFKLVNSMARFIETNSVGGSGEGVGIFWIRYQGKRSR